MSKIAIVTGANKGIGYETAKQLAETGIKTILACRTESLGKEAEAKLRSFGLDVTFRQLDMSDDHSIDAFVESFTKEYKSLDILINNAGISQAGGGAGGSGVYDAPEFRKTARSTLQTNYYGLLRLSDALLPLLRKAPAPRLVNVASELGHKAFLGSYADPVVYSAESLTIPQLSGYVEKFISDVESGLPTINDGIAAIGMPPVLTVYCYSKIALIAATNVYARDPANQRVLINAVCPGHCATDLGSSSGGVRPAEVGARTPVLLALLPEGSTVNGQFWVNEAVNAW